MLQNRVGDLVTFSGVFFLLSPTTVSSATINTTAAEPPHREQINENIQICTDSPYLGVKYFWKIPTRGTSSTRSILGFDTASTASTPSISGVYTFGYFHTRSISGLDSVVTPCTRSTLGFDTLQYCLYLKYFGVLYCSYFEYSQYQNSLNMRSILGV